MSPTLPIEVIGLIIDEIWRTNDIHTICSLSLVAKSFTAPCQERLWRTVVLHSSGTSYQSRTSVMQARMLQSSPHIGGYVRYLNVQVVSPEPHIYKEQAEDLDCFGRALKLMPNVVELRLAFEGERSFATLRFSQFPESLREAVIQIVTDRGLRSLTLVKVAAFPLEAMKDALGHLERLEVLKLSFDGMRSSSWCVLLLEHGAR